MVVFLVMVAALAAALGRSLHRLHGQSRRSTASSSAILLAGIVYIFRQVMLLNPEIAWIESFREQPPIAI